MIAVDTNVLVRLFVADDQAQAARVAKLFATEKRLLVPRTVVLELVWVLEAVYGLPRANIVRVLETLAGLERVELESRVIVERAISLFADGFEDLHSPAASRSEALCDFADALHLCAAMDATDFITFDRKFQNRARRLVKVPQVRAP